MATEVDFQTVSTEGLESSPVADALAGLRANEARYFKNKYDHVFTVEPAAQAQDEIAHVARILKEERDIGLSINVLYTLEESGKRAVGFKLSDGMEVPPELASRFKFARQKSKLAGTIRGSYFVIKGEY